MPNLFENAEIIHAYTRQQAIADGALVAVPEAIAHEAGFRYPVALTRAVWLDCVKWTDEDTRRTGMPQDEAGRLWDALWMTKHAIRRAGPDDDRVRVRLVRVSREQAPPADEDGYEPPEVGLWAVVGPGDDAEPVITLMFEGED